jgi:hypothetical protein
VLRRRGRPERAVLLAMACRPRHHEPKRDADCLRERLAARVVRGDGASDFPCVGVGRVVDADELPTPEGARPRLRLRLPFDYESDRAASLAMVSLRYR